jgi:hypothetical protein
MELESISSGAKKSKITKMKKNRSSKKIIKKS